MTAPSRETAGRAAAMGMLWSRLPLFGLSAGRMGAYVALALAATFFEGFGMAMFLPVLEYVEKGGEAAASLAQEGGMWLHLQRVFGWVGLEISLPALVGAAVVLMLVRVGLTFARTVYTSWLTQEMLHVTRTNMFKAYLSMNYGTFNACSSGSLLNILITEIRQLASGLASLLSLASNAAVLAGFVCVLLWLSPPMTGLAFLFLFLAGLLVSYVVRHMRRVSFDSTEANESLSKMLIERLGAFRLIKLTATGAREEDNVFQSSGQVRNHYFRIARLLASVDLIVEPAVLLVGGGILCFAVMAFGMSLAKVGLFMLILLRMLPLSKELLKLHQSWRSCSGSVAIVLNGLTMATEAHETDGGARTFTPMEQGIRMRDVHFAYPGEDAEALRGVDLDIPAGRVTALVGPSGAGKSTLADLVPRLRMPTSGAVLYDGVDGAEFRLDSLRRQMAFVSQDATTLDDTVAANLRFAVPEATEAEVWDALDRAQARQFVEAMPLGLETILGERGVRLSGGQKQRLSLARALLQKSSILILDEPTSALDSETERAIQRAIRTIRDEGRTTIIIIAHRLSTVRDADKIVVLKDGRVGESGTHAELLRGGDWYKEMCAMQGAAGEDS